MPYPKTFVIIYSGLTQRFFQFRPFCSCFILSAAVLIASFGSYTFCLCVHGRTNVKWWRSGP
jgi:hypothetical protein